jgi:hypothetical protein
MSDNRKQDMLSRIRAMRERTQENGCTEEEAMAAALKAAELMDKYGFSEADLSLPKEAITEDTYFGDGKFKLGQLHYTINGIGQFCDCKSWSQSINNKVVGLKYFGRESDVAVAVYLTHLCNTALWSAWKDYMPNRDVRSRRSVERRSFQRAMAIRLSQRLIAMKKARSAHIDPESGRAGQELVVLKNAVVDEAYAERLKNLNLRDSRGPSRARLNAGAVAAGLAAGDRVRLSDGIHGDKLKQIK